MMVFRVIMLCHCLPLYLNLNLNLYAAAETTSEESEGGCQQELRRIVDVKGPDSIVWVVQLSDLHFSVHHPDRALDFNNFVGPALSFITPSLVFITGDLTDGKSKDLLTMKQNEDEWLEYRNVMEDVIKRSRLDKTLFFDLRRQLWRPTARRLLDFFSKYSISGHLGRSRNVNSVTLQVYLTLSSTIITADRKHLFVGVDSTMPVGLRGPTNLFAHPIDQLLAELDTHLSQWNSRSQELLSKISFGHFPLSFSATSNSGKSLKDIFLNHSISAYICGHLHSRFGRNLKRRHLLSHHFLSLQKFFQLNVHRPYFHSAVNCSTEAPAGKEFWEWEMGEWKRSRAMRILAIDRGHVSYVDIDFKSGTKGQSSCQLFPWTHGSRQYLHPITNMNVMIWSLYLTAVRALVFSVSPIASITTKIYDSRPGFLYLVFEAPMHMIGDNTSRGDLFVGPWNHRAFDDPVPNRYWLQIEATDFMGRSTLSDLRPFSVNGLTTTISWTWKEFMVMGCQWAALYYPMLWCAVYFILCVLLIPKAILIFSVRHFTYKNKGFVNAIGLVFQELCKLPVAWFGFLGYLFYLILFPWFIGQVFTDGKDKGYMTYMGWVVKSFNQNGKHKIAGLSSKHMR